MSLLNITSQVEKHKDNTNILKKANRTQIVHMNYTHSVLK